MSTTIARPSAAYGRRLLLLGTATAALASVLIAGPQAATPARADSLTFQVTNYDNDGTNGVYLRNSSNVSDVNRDSAHYLTYGTSVELVCGTSGSAVGPKSNTAWDYVRVLGGSNSGRSGYLSEHWINTPVGPNQHVGGEPTCGSAGGPTTTVQRAINWAVSYNGRNFDSGYCLRFVIQAYSAAGVNIGSATTAARYWSTNPRGYARHTDRSPAIGSLVFWGATPKNSAGHVGIYLGNNTVISTSSWPEASSGTAVHEWSFSGRNSAGYPYLGWIAVA